ncbi:hypothetical protein CCO03_11530 [Comamonas serinivorans]|uniref:ABC transporter substrate-binding protein n=1 Tax=Comamonas serinivorans TaxID=1082851 RepID=A0A1Y0ENN7_9BURK|nr:tripartite tricarboxylate transporter substrate binding protein [Comamonas serinivorans]ARU05227.1 hypothetical protein CCO03_11530 [Comamonas serinivorans]
MNAIRRTTWALAAGLALMSTAMAQAPAPAQDAASYPNRPVKVIVGWAAGGATDVIARVLSEKWSKSMGQSFVVDNKPGAGGIMGADALAKSPPDGYTISVFLSATLTANQFVYNKLPYNPDKDFALITHLTNGAVVLAARPETPYATAREFADYIKAHPGKVKYGSYGTGSFGHVIMAYIDEMQRGQMTHVPYKGETPLLQDLVGGSVELALVSVANSEQHVKAGKLKYLGVTGPKRLQALPNVPTLAEQGLDEVPLKMVGWTGIAAPAGTPKPIIDKLVAETHKALQDPAVQARIMGFGNEVVTNGTPAEALARYKADVPIWKKLVDLSGARAN